LHQHTKDIRYVIHGKEPRKESDGDKSQKGTKTRAAKKRGKSDDEPQPQASCSSSSVSRSTPSAHSSDTASVCGSGDSVADEKCSVNFKDKGTDGLPEMMPKEDADDLHDLHRGVFLEGIHFTTPKEEEKPKPQQKAFAKCPPVASFPAAAATVTSNSRVPVAREGLGTNVHNEKDARMMQQHSGGPHEHHSGYFVVDTRRHAMIHDSEAQQQQQQIKGPSAAHTRHYKYGSSVVGSTIPAFGAGASNVNEGYGAYFRVTHESASSLLHQRRTVQGNFDMWMSDSMPAAAAPAASAGDDDINVRISYFRG
jgi:hypothetical protein